MSDFRHSSIARLHHTHQFVGKKIRRVRWQKLPQAAALVGGVLPEKFATASWDEGPGSKNEIVLWHVAAEDVNVDEAKRPRDGAMMDEDDDRFSLTNAPETDWKFVRSAAVEVHSDIHEMQFLNEDHILFGTAKGDLVVAKWFPPERSIRPLQSFRQLHGDGEASVAFSLFGNDVVSLGSNGTLARVDLSDSIDNYDAYGEISSSSSFGPLLCIEHFGANEVVTGNAVGQLQLWDLRQRPQTPQQLPSAIQSCGAVTAIRSHPSQRHILVAGYQSGNLAFWDLRSGSLSVTSSVEDIHSGPIWELQFHPIYPSHFYSASNDGLVLHWDASGVKLIGDNFSVSPWSLSTDQIRDQLKLTSLIPDNTMPVNSLDVVGDSILAGVDDESVWMIKNLPIL